MNADWDEQARFGYTVKQAGKLWLVSFRFWNRVDWYVFQDLPDPSHMRHWRSALNRVPVDGFAPYEQVDLVPIGHSDTPRFLVTTWTAGCSGAGSSVHYQAYELRPEENRPDLLFERIGEIGDDDYWPGTGKADDKTSGSSPPDTYHISSKTMMLPWCERSLIDTWDHADLCYVETYDIDPAGIRFRSLRSNQPDLETIVKASTYALAHDERALQGYTVNRQVAEQLEREMPVFFFKDGIDVVPLSGGRETVDFMVDGKSVIKFALERKGGAWRVAGMIITNDFEAQ
jgi:hypothetical protein